MAKEATSKKTRNSQDESMMNRFSNSAKNKLIQTIIGLFFISFALFLFSTFISFLIYWEQDQSTLSEFGNKDIRPKNATGQVGSGLGNLLMYNGFGIAAFVIPYLFLNTGIRFTINKNKNKIIPDANWWLIGMLLTAVTIGYVDEKNAVLSGIIGFELNDYLQAFLGKTGLLILIVFLTTTFIIIKFKVTVDNYLARFKVLGNTLKKDTSDLIANKKTAKRNFDDTITTAVPNATPSIDEPRVESTLNKEAIIAEVTKTEQDNKLAFTFETAQEEEKSTDFSAETFIQEEQKKHAQNKIEQKQAQAQAQAQETIIDKSVINDDIRIDVETIKKEKTVSENLSEQLVKDFGEFDPKLELSEYRFPTFNLLKKYNETISTDTAELESNKNKIVETLKNYKIGIDQIKAIVGPTITLYEIVPEAGVRISKIKNLEDDIALSLSALGIRIIAPIPGKGTIGIEVPNTNSSIVSMHSVISSKKFQESQMELPLALGKTISNETFVVDLAKMPHLLMAGATGQGKSVGLNAILTSLLYRKHPAEIKFVLVDPKKVELTLFNRIERHYLAKLPDNEEAIITDTTKVIHTLNSLCIEMDNRYDLLKLAMVRNIKEYNAKLKLRKLNPDNGHRFLPYIILVIDEFADLIMTAGKEVETPVARLAQLARAIGIHLIVATQRPSVNVITGMIKANFPARIAFRVTSKIDSRTILDASGADQLIGRGDMLYSGGNDLTRIQCAFVDTPEVEKITTFIGSQRAYPEAYLLPEYEGEDGGTNVDIDINDRDKLFKQAAELIVTAQQGSASLLQRKLKLGYNRAGRIIDQLEAAGIVGQFEGSKARKVLIPDLMSLDLLLKEE